MSFADLHAGKVYDHSLILWGDGFKKTIGRHGEMVVATHGYDEFFWPGDPIGQPLSLTTVTPDGMSGELVNNNDYASYLVMKEFRKERWVIEKYGRGRNLCYMDLTKADKRLFCKLLEKYKAENDSPVKFRELGMQQDWYEGTGPFTVKDTARVKRIIKQVRANKDYMKQYRLDKLAGRR
jgi:hypothetical protein